MAATLSQSSAFFLNRLAISAGVMLGMTCSVAGLMLPQPSDNPGALAIGPVDIYRTNAEAQTAETGFSAISRVMRRGCDTTRLRPLRFAL
jgi:hypothetical protein